MFSAQNSQVSSAANYIEDMFSTYLYNGNSTTQTITNGIDLAGKGGLVWIKCRSTTGTNHNLIDSVRGISKFLYTNDTSAQANDPGTITSFNSNGFTQNNSYGDLNSSGRTYTSWTFREQPKFFDIVTYTGTGSNTTIPHNLGSVPGCIIIKRTDAIEDWNVYHRSLANTQYMILSGTAAALTGTTRWNSTTPTSTVFSLGTSTIVNASGGSYVAYLFAHDAGGFGLAGTDNVISCGTFTTDGTGAAGNITLGYEAQWILLKRSDGVGGWNIIDTMRGSSLTSYNYLSPNTSSLESSSTSAGQGIFPTATGFFVGTNFPAASATYIYIAIRRPMKVPTLGTSVFSPSATTAATGTVITTGFPVDAQIIQYRTPSGGNVLWQDRLRRVNTTDTETNNPILTSNDTSAESSTFSTTRYWNNTGYQISASLTGQNRIYWNFRRAPGFFDEVCYTGTGSLANTQNHNLTVVPELIITKIRSGGTESGVGGWGVYAAPLGITKVLELNSTVASATDNWFQTTPTSSVFTVYGNDPHSNRANGNYVAYLFATCLGVSKVGSYTGNGSSQTISCGFTSGARFVMIKRTDSTGDWYLWDTARGIVSGNDPHLSLNTTAAEVTTDDTIDPDNSGFIVNQVAATNVNVSSATYIFLAIA